MRRYKLTDKIKAELLKQFYDKISAYEDELTQDKITIDVNMNVPLEEKISVIFSPDAYIRCQMLVKTFTGEVGWNGLAKKLDDKTYYVYDIMVYPQIVSGARTLDPTTTNDWYEKYDEVLDEMMFQAHSHVNMSTSPSNTDLDNQANIVKNMQGTGFRIFQIWNKQGDINTFLYDLDTNTVYDRKDIVIEIGTEEFGTVNRFIENAKEMVEDMPPVTYKPTALPVPKKEEKKEEERKPYSWEKTYPEEKEKKEDRSWYWEDGMGGSGYCQ